MELVDKAALETYIADLCQSCGCAPDDERCHCYIEDIYIYLNTAKIIKAEPVKHGRWVPMYELTSEGILPDEPMGYMCDQCKAKRRKQLNYCSNCGARMNG